MSIRIATGTELVVCKTHGVQRMAKYCNPSPVFNADRDVVSYAYMCHPSMQCSSSKERATAFSTMQAVEFPSSDKVSKISDDRLAMLENSGKPATPASGAPGAQRGVVGGGAGGPGGNAKRYYDLSTFGGGAGRSFDRPKKVCWSCGLDTHEKPQCRNQLCKRCHGLQGSTGSYNHVCNEIPPSPFVLLEPLASDELRYVRCVVCQEYGHIDCRPTDGSDAPRVLSSSAAATPRDSSVLTCCHCGDCGHHGFDCPHQQYPDRWIMCVQSVGRQIGYIPPERRGSSQPSAPWSSAPSYRSATPSHSNAAPVYYPPQKRQRDDHDHDEASIRDFRQHGGQAQLYNEISASSDFRSRNVRGFTAPQQSSNNYYRGDSNQGTFDYQPRYQQPQQQQQQQQYTYHQQHSNVSRQQSSEPSVQPQPSTARYQPQQQQQQQPQRFQYNRSDGSSHQQSRYVPPSQSRADSYAQPQGAPRRGQAQYAPDRPQQQQQQKRFSKPKRRYESDSDDDVMEF